jgi:hypothetical protein
MAFGAFTMGCDRTDIIEFMIDEPTTGKLEDRPLIARLLEDPDYLAIYHDYLEELITGPFSPKVIVPIIDETADLIRVHVYADTTKFFTAEEFEQALDSDLVSDPNAAGMSHSTVIGLKAFVNERAASIREQLDGLAPACGDGSGNCSDGSLPEPGELSFEDAIAEVSPSYAMQGDMNVILTIKLNEQVMMPPPDAKPSHVKIGNLEGSEIIRNGLEITALFYIPMNETLGLKDVSIQFEPPDGFPPSGGFPPIGGSPPPGGFSPPSDFPFPLEDGLVFMKPGAFEVLAVY